MLLLHRLLMSLPQSLHLLLLFVTAMDGFANGTAHRTSHILAPVIVGEHIPGTDAVGDETLLIFAFRYVLPQPLHSGAVRSDRTPAVVVLTLGGVSQQQQPLLLVPEDLLPIRHLPLLLRRPVGRRSGNIARRRGCRQRCLGWLRLRVEGGWTLRLWLRNSSRLSPHHWIDVGHVHHPLRSRLCGQRLRRQRLLLWLLLRLLLWHVLLQR